MIHTVAWLGTVFWLGAPCQALSSLSDPTRRSVAVHSSASVEHIPFLATSSLGEASRSRLSTWREALEEDPKLFQGCSHVFLDVGSNRGTHIRKLFEPHKYPRSSYVKIFEKNFGHWIDRRQPSSKTGICAFGFEANPEWASELKAIEKSYKKQGWRVKFFNVAVSNTTGEVDFWVRNSTKDKKSNWGATILPFSHRVEEFRYSDERTVRVPKLDLSSFVEEMRKKSLPGFKLMKMDIEGSEFVVLPRFLEKQLLCKNVLDMLTIEWHEHLLSDEDARATGLEIHGEVEDPNKCTSGPSTDVWEMDDESYLADGAPLP